MVLKELRVCCRKGFPSDLTLDPQINSESMVRELGRGRGRAEADQDLLVA